MCWIWLFLAIALEVSATVFMKLSNGFTRVLPTVSMFVFYGLSLIPMVGALKQMDVSAVYAIWSAVGTALVATLGIFLFDEPASALKVISIVLIIVGVVCLNLSTRQKSVPNRTPPLVAKEKTRIDTIDSGFKAAASLERSTLASHSVNSGTLQ